ncbi:hypothetical protein [Halothiobacillus sp. DCM-1]|uniref:hypothetical protein n=1 Tax=Halothiobacillus sp. DCM-1 TaxID=3112558 RepID=UPI00324CCC86
MTPEVALRWLGITPWLPRREVPGAPSIEAARPGDQPPPESLPDAAPVAPRLQASSPVSLWLVNLTDELPLIAAILRALPADARWQAVTEADAEPALRLDDGSIWLWPVLQAEGVARRALWRRLHRLPAGDPRP